MMAKTPRDPPGPSSPELTAAAWLAFAGFSIGLFQLDSAVGLDSDRLGEALAVALADVVRVAVADGVAVVRPVAGAGAAVGAAGAGATGGAGAAVGAGAGAGAFFAGGAFDGSGVGVGEPVEQSCVGRHGIGVRGPRRAGRRGEGQRRGSESGRQRCPQEMESDHWFPLQLRRTVHAPSLVPGIFLQGGGGSKSLTSGSPEAGQSGVCALCPSPRCSPGRE